MTFPLSPFAIPVGSFPFPVPPPGEQPGGCSSLTVEFPSEWLPYILGALQQLTLQATWQGTSEEQGILEERAWAIITLFGQAKCRPAQQALMVCGEDEGDMGCGCFRFQNGILQQFCCGQWVDVPGQSQPAGQNQPGPQPAAPAPGGGQATTCFQLAVNQRTFAPFIVNSGDTILIEIPSGATTDGTEVIWRGQSGEQFFNNTYIPTTQVFKPGDQNPTAPHMGLIAFIGGVAYDVYASNPAGNPSLFTVPPGVVNESVLFGINKPNDGLGSGNVSFCAKFTNNQAVTWVHEFDLTIAAMGWVPYHTTFDHATYIAGQGYGSVLDPVTGVDTSLDILSPILAAVHTITRVEVFYFTDSDDGGVATDRQVGYGAAFTTYGLLQPGAGTFDTPINNTVVTDRLNISVDRTGAPFSPNYRINQIIVSGQGTDPF